MFIPYVLEGGLFKAFSVLEQPAVMFLPRWLTSLWSRARLFPWALPWTYSCSILCSTASSRWLRAPSVPVNKRFISFWWATRKRSREPSCSGFEYSWGKVDKVVCGGFQSVVLNMSARRINKEINRKRFASNYNCCCLSSKKLSHTRRLLALHSGNHGNSNAKHR